MIDNCAKVKPGMNVLIIAANDGLHGGVNIVDQETVAWLHAAVVQRRADATVIWCDIPSRPAIIWRRRGPEQGLARAARRRQRYACRRCSDQQRGRSDLRRRIARNSRYTRSAQDQVRA